MKKHKSFRGQTAVITGAANGIGRGIALSLAKRGCNLALADVNEDGLEETARLAATNEVRISRHYLDVGSKDQIAAFPASVLKDHDGVDVLANNAGVALGGTFDDVAEDDFEWLININFWGVIRMTRAFMPLLKKSDDASLINISSLYGLVAPPGQTAYCASKFGVRGFTQSLRHELKDTNVSITAVHPGGIATDIANNARMASALSEKEIQDGLARARKHLKMPPEQAGEIIVQGAERRKARILVGNDAKIISFIERIIPVGYWNVMEKLVGAK